MRKLISMTSDGLYRLPALVDAHVHIESSHLIPSNFGRLLASQGTLYAICDPHEIVNVMGTAGLDLMLADAARSPARLFFSLPSCVPSTPFETSGAAISASDTAALFNAHPELVALGEMMNVPGVLARDPEVIAKIASAKHAGKPIDGHFPGGRGKALLDYAAAGISSDHEAVSADEALEKIAAGMTVYIREGSAARNLEATLPAVNDDNWEHFCFCTDDISVHDLLTSGGIINCIRKAVKLGMDPERAVALASVNPARHYGITLHDDDFILVKDLVDFQVVKVFKGGQPLGFDGSRSCETSYPNTVHIPDLSSPPVLHEHPDIPRPTSADDRISVIGVHSGSILTDHLRVSPGETDGLAQLAVIERHGKNGGVAAAWVAGTGLHDGAIASTVAHDHHNLIVLGKRWNDMRLAAEHLAKVGGGLCVAKAGSVIAHLPLPVAGLMSPKPPQDLADEIARTLNGARSTGCTLDNPFDTLSFLSLPVIPELKLTDRGLIEIAFC